MEDYEEIGETVGTFFSLVFTPVIVFVLIKFLLA